MLAAFGILHGFYHLSYLTPYYDYAPYLDLATALILVMLGMYYSNRVVAFSLFLLTLPETATYLVPVTLIVAFILFARLAIISKSIRSLQAQLSIFIIVWIVAELLRSLLLLNVFSASASLQTLGLEIHTAAMLAFGVVHALPILQSHQKPEQHFSGVARKRKHHPAEKRWGQEPALSQEKSGETFNSVLKRSVQEGIASVVGRQTAIAVEFYLDPSVASKDIAGYTLSLEKMFTLGSKLIEERCAQALYHNMGLNFQKRDDYNLTNYVEEAKKKWLLGETAR